MNKGLEHLEILENLVELYGHFSFDFTVIEQELKALEIIKSKRVCVYRISFYDNVDRYNTYAIDDDRKLTEADFNLIKEWLVNGKS